MMQYIERHFFKFFCLVFFGIWLLLLTSCSTVPVNERPDPCKSYVNSEGKVIEPKSYIYEKFKDPKIADIALQIGFSKSIDYLPAEKRKEVLNQTYEVCTAIKYLLVDNQLTFNLLFGYLNAQIELINKYAGDEVVILLNEVDTLNAAIVIPACDSYLIGVEMDHVINLVKLKRIRYGLE